MAETWVEAACGIMAATMNGVVPLQSSMQYNDAAVVGSEISKMLRVNSENTGKTHYLSFSGCSRWDNP